jgi:hypothetical protein
VSCLINAELASDRMENAFNDWDMMQSFKTKLAKITKLHYDDLWVTPCWLYLVAIAPAGALLGLAILQPWVPVSRLLKDPSTITGAHPFVGLVSHIGIVLWCMTAAICLYAGALAVTQRRTAGDASFLIAAGLLTGLLAFDDLFLFHEWIGPRLLSLNEVAILACYGILAAAYIVLFRRQIMRHGLLLFAASVLFGATSVLGDLSPIVIGYEDMTIGVIEDGAKFIAIALWAAFHIFAAWTTNRSPAGSGWVGSGARSLRSPAAAELHRQNKTSALRR